MIDEKILAIMIQQFQVWLQHEDAWQPPEGVDVDIFNATKATDAMEHVYRNTEFAKTGLEWADKTELQKHPICTMRGRAHECPRPHKCSQGRN